MAFSASTLSRAAFGLAFLFAVVFSSVNAEASKDIKKEYLAHNIIKLAKGQQVLLVVKSIPALYVIGDELGTHDAYYVISGKAKGDKQRRGDLKTPEGTYFFVETIDGKELPGRYGILAVVMDYPNPIDKLLKKTGSGIWLHGTDDPPRLKRPRESKGCVVGLDDDILRIINYIEIGRTPIIVVEELTRGAFKEAGPEAGVEAKVEAGRTGKEITEFLIKKDFLKSIEKNNLSIFRHGIGFVATVARGRSTDRYYLKKEKAGWSFLGKKTRIIDGQHQRLLDQKEKPRYKNRK